LLSTQHCSQCVAGHCLSVSSPHTALFVGLCPATCGAWKWGRCCTGLVGVRSCCCNKWFCGCVVEPWVCFLAAVPWPVLPPLLVSHSVGVPSRQKVYTILRCSSSSSSSSSWLRSSGAALPALILALPRRYRIDTLTAGLCFVSVFLGPKKVVRAAARDCMTALATLAGWATVVCTRVRVSADLQSTARSCCSIPDSDCFAPAAGSAVCRTHCLKPRTACSRETLDAWYACSRSRMFLTSAASLGVF